ncbi:MAG: sulfite exporter TauE/SafE family protein [Cyanobacteriota bacterium ELA615]
MVSWFLIVALGFVGSFGHCVGMCGPLAVTFSLSQKRNSQLSQQFTFHILLNLGRVLSYTLVGAGIGAVGSIIVAGIGSELREYLVKITGIILIWMGLIQIKPKWLPKFPIVHPLLKDGLHQSLSSAMLKLSNSSHQLMPLLLGVVWGLIPCGFLYIAQIKAAETGDIFHGALIMFGFGLGTLPSMLAVGIWGSRLSSSKRSQLFRFGGWLMILMGLVNLQRSGNTMNDLTGYGSVFCLMLALIARPINRIMPALLEYRRLLGVGSFILAVAHTLHMLQHTFNWNFTAIGFMLPEQQVSIFLGLAALLLLLPAACTSFDHLAKRLGKYWRYIHLLSIPALIFGILHIVLINGFVPRSWLDNLMLYVTITLAFLVLLIRQRWFWNLLGLENYYGSIFKSSTNHR